MKRLLLILLVTSCASPMTNVTNIQQTRHVMNSLWKEVTSSIKGSRSVNLDANVAAYNAAHIDDQWFIVDGEIPTLENAPPCQVYIVDRDTHVPLTFDDGNGNMVPFSHANWPRKQLVENYLGWMRYADSSGGEMYIDVIPPAPTVPTADELYALYSVYVLNPDGSILYEWHCNTVPDGFPGYTPKQYFQTMLNVANLEVQQRGDAAGLRVVSGYIYTAP